MSKKSPGYIYFIVASEGDLMRVKIGHTTKDPQKRLQSLQCGSPIGLGIYTAFEGFSQEIEKKLHDTFAPVSVRGEWFEVKGKLRDFLLYYVDDALTRKPLPGWMLLNGIVDVVLATEPFREDDDPTEYAASADTRHWDWMPAAMEAEGVE